MEDQRSTCTFGRRSGILVNDLCFLAPRAIQRTVATGGTIKVAGSLLTIHIQAFHFLTEHSSYGRSQFY